MASTAVDDIPIAKTPSFCQVQLHVFRIGNRWKHVERIEINVFNVFGAALIVPLERSTAFQAIEILTTTKIGCCSADLRGDVIDDKGTQLCG